MRTKPNAITVCVDFSDLLSISLPRNAHHFGRIVVVSDFSDSATAAVVATIPNAILFQTNEFYLDGARFNKGRALESGLDVLGREGMICILDADIIIPRHADLTCATPGKLWTPRRRILTDISRWQEFVAPGADWDELPLNRDEEWAGYFQLFHAGDMAIADRQYWYEPNWTHAGGADSMFAEYWPRAKRARPPFEVLHLGEDGRNWCGRCTPRVDGSIHPQASERAAELQRLLTLRAKTGTFKAEKIRSA